MNTPDTRRKLLRSIAAGGSVAAVTAWHRPIVNAVMLPAHAQTTAPTPTPVLATLSGTLSPSSIQEGGIGTFTFTLSAPLSSDLTFFLTVGGTTGIEDFIAFGDEFTIPAGETNFDISFFPMGNDNTLEGPETAILSINPASLSLPGVAVPDTLIGTFELIDQDLTTATVGFLTAGMILTEGNTIGIDVQVNTPQIGNPLNVNLNVSSTLIQGTDFTLTGANYNAATNTLTFPGPGITQTIWLNSLAGAGDVTFDLVSTTPYTVALGNADSVTIAINGTV